MQKADAFYRTKYAAAQQNVRQRIVVFEQLQSARIKGNGDHTGNLVTRLIMYFRMVSASAEVGAPS